MKALTPAFVDPCGAVSIIPSASVSLSGNRLPVRLSSVLNLCFFFFCRCNTDLCFSLHAHLLRLALCLFLLFFSRSLSPVPGYCLPFCFVWLARILGFCPHSHPFLSFLFLLPALRKLFSLLLTDQSMRRWRGKANDISSNVRLSKREKGPHSQEQIERPKSSYKSDDREKLSEGEINSKRGWSRWGLQQIQREMKQRIIKTRGRTFHYSLRLGWVGWTS